MRESAKVGEREGDLAERRKRMIKRNEKDLEVASYSARRASIGLMRKARRTGNQHAVSAVSNTSMTTPPTIRLSVGPEPTSNLERK